HFLSEAGGSIRLSSRVAERLAGKIRDGELPAGARLPSEDALSRHFGVSRTVIREAMASLRAEGAIATRHGIGAFVLGGVPRASAAPDALTLRSMESLLNILEVRRGVEAAAAAHAAARRTDEHLADIRNALAAITRATERGSDGVEEDVRFHHAIARATGNPYWVQLVESYAEQIRQAVRVTRANEARRADFARQVQAEHERIVDAIAAGDEARARRAAAAHMEHAVRRVSAADRAFWQAEGGELARGLLEGRRTI
ncbi:MAG: FadR/GntR family transcriptional regulator, partial [Thiohalocapsa sp.]